MRVESARRVALGSTAIVLVALVVASASVGATVVGHASATNGTTETAQATEIDSCTTITEPGRYVLTTDIENATQTCIEIVADGVVFDGAGHTVAASPSRFARHTGIRVTNAEETVVTNVTLTDWGFAGLYLRGVTDVRVENVTATDSQFGVTVRSSEQVRVVGVEATNNSAAGIDLSTTSDSVVADSTVAENRVGISITTTSRRNRVVRSTIRDNRIGVVLSNADNNRVVNNAFCGNREAILRLEQPRGNEIESNEKC